MVAVAVVAVTTIPWLLLAEAADAFTTAAAAWANTAILRRAFWGDCWLEYTAISGELGIAPAAVASPSSPLLLPSLLRNFLRHEGARRNLPPSPLSCSHLRLFLASSNLLSVPFAKRLLNSRSKAWRAC